MSLEVLTIENYAENVKEELLKQLENVVVQINKVNKNGKMLTGITIRENDSKVGITMYIDEGFERGIPIDTVASEIIGTYKKAEKPSKIELDDFTNYDAIKEKLRIMLVNTKRNNNCDYALKQAKGFDDLSYLAYIQIRNTEYNGQVKVTNKLLDAWNVELDDVISQATLNTLNAGYDCINIYKYIRQIVGEEATPFLPQNEPPLYVVSNEYKVNGAINAILHSVEIAKILNEEKFYIIPCSIHEAICVPYSEIANGEYLEDLKNMILNVNATEIREEEFLSNNLFAYENGVFKTIA